MKLIVNAKVCRILLLTEGVSQPTVGKADLGGTTVGEPHPGRLSFDSHWPSM